MNKRKLVSLEFDKIDLFPTTVANFKLGRDFTDDEMSFIDTLDQRGNEFNKTSTNSYVLEEEILSDLKQFCTDAVNDYFYKVYKPSEDVKLVITQSWVNYTNTNEAHHKHFHPNSVLSGVLYIQTQSDDKIVFYNPKDLPYEFKKIDFNFTNSPSWWLPTGKASLLLFPSTLEHSVPRKETFGTRISLSFNTFWNGPIGSENSLTRLIVSGR